MQTFYDRGSLVDRAVSTVAKALMEAIALVLLLLFAFLGNLRAAVVVALILPLSALSTFVLMRWYGLSANLMSLGGLAIAIGLMVDGAVVVVENAFVRLGERAQSGESAVRILFDAASEVGKPVLFGVGIIILVFMPLLSLEGMEGKMFAPLALTIGIALSISLLLSFTLTPVLCSWMLKGGADHDTRAVALLKKPYLRLLERALAHPRGTAAAALGMPLTVPAGKGCSRASA